MASHRDYVTNVTHTHTIVKRYFGSGLESAWLLGRPPMADCAPTRRDGSHDATLKEIQESLAELKA